MKTVELMFFDAGGGHRSAANALREVAERGEGPGLVRLSNLQELMPELDFCRKLVGVGLADIYNAMLRHGWTLGSPALLRVLQAALRLSHRSQVDLLVRHWRQVRPDMVVSLVPHFNRAMYEAIQRVMPDVPFVTILTDLADYPPHFWIEERQRQYFICGTVRATHQALEAGHSGQRVFQTSGMILHPRFYDPIPMERARDVAALELDPTLPTAMLMFGGEGSSAMPRIAQRLDESGLRVQVIAVCGRNGALAATMRATRRRMPMFVTSFTPDVARLMRLSDFFIGKPGPGSISEAVAMGLPVIVERNHRTLPQERYNADWVEAQGYGISVRSFERSIVDATSTMLDPARHRRLVARVAAQQNRAVFQVPGILARILTDHAASRSLSPRESPSH
jgi:1,2-diacylglycerol 3-beta-galactosyltransferase